MYAERKGWELGEVEVDVDIDYDGDTPNSFDVDLRLPASSARSSAIACSSIAGNARSTELLDRRDEVTVSDRVEVL